jgi:DNA-binding MarR family transcriptional regulator
LYDAPVTSTAPHHEVPDEEPRHEPTEDVVDQLFRLMHTLTRFRTAAQPDVADVGDRLGNNLLFQLLTNGAMRSGELAEHTGVDPSTVSRQVAMLVRDGLLERRADPHDGRAALLHATEAGRERQRAQAAVRNAHYEQMLAGWSVADKTMFAELLARFVGDFDSYKTTMLRDITHPRGCQVPTAAAGSTPPDRREPQDRHTSVGHRPGFVEHRRTPEHSGEDSQ